MYARQHILSISLYLKDASNLIFYSLQSDGNFITWTQDDSGKKKKEILVWKSDSTSSTSETYFLGIDCSYRYIGVYRGSPSTPGKLLWSGETTKMVQETNQTMTTDILP